MAQIQAEAVIEKFRYALKNKWGYIWGTAGELWTAEDQKRLEKTTDSDRAQGRKYGAMWIGHYVADCSGLFTWAFRQLGGTMYHGSDTMYLKWCNNKGELKDGKRTDGCTLKPGTAVFCWNGKKYSHVGLYIGDGKVIESATTTQGVIISKVTANKWKYWGELKGVTFDGKTPEPVLPTLRKGDKGEYVTLLQTKLKNKGYDLGKWGVDGDFGSATQAAVKAFQRNAGLTDDGVVGQKTWAALEQEQTESYTVTIAGLTKEQAESLKNQYQNCTVTKGA